MHIFPTSLPGLMILEPKVFEDPRGYFFESYNEKKMQELGINIHWVQDNQSKSSYGVLRGLHYQMHPWAQTKLVRVLEGEIFDVAVDLRKDSPTFRQWYGLRLSAANKKQLLVPKGFAHGFSVLSDTAVVFYKCDQIYNPSAERGVIYNDPELGINWELDAGAAILSPKDLTLPDLKNAENNFHHQDV